MRGENNRKSLLLKQVGKERGDYIPMFVVMFVAFFQHRDIIKMEILKIIPEKMSPFCVPNTMFTPIDWIMLEEYLF